jgi:hypothetical protein
MLMNEMKTTNTESVKNLAKSILTRLENQKSILINPVVRDQLRNEIYALLQPAIVTEQDLHEQTLARIGATADQLQDTQITESAQYRAAKSIVRKTMGDDQLNGFYFQKNLKQIAIDVRKYLMSADHVEEVFETDDDLEQMVVDVIKRFSID